MSAYKALIVTKGKTGIFHEGTASEQVSDSVDRYSSFLMWGTMKNSALLLYTLNQNTK